MNRAADATSRLCASLERAFSVHLDPRWGSRYWLEKAKRLGFDPRVEIRDISDLPRLGLMEPKALRGHPIGHFVPESVLSDPQRLIVCQTGGTLGAPVWCVYTEDEFEAAFVQPFVAAGRYVGFPVGKSWLYVGPSGPHIIGRAADAIARGIGSAAPFAVDFDPRWARALQPGSFSAKRYLDHVVRQSMDVMNTQEVQIIFTTPIVLRELAGHMTTAQREKIAGVHYGGMVLSTEALLRFQKEDFPNAVHLSGYGNTLFGCCLELDACIGRTLRYFPCGRRLIFGVLEDDQSGAETPTYERPGAQGRIVFSRLDDSMLLVNVLERDSGRLVLPPGDSPEEFVGFGVETPHTEVLAEDRAGVGLY